VEAEQTLAEVARLRDAARARAHGGVWLPAVAVALLLLGSIVLYRDPFGEPSSITAEFPFWAGLADQQRSPAASYAYWFLGVPLVLAATAVWYRWRERHLGVRVAWPVFAAVAGGALLILAVLAAVPEGQPADGIELASGMFWPGLLTPLLPVAAGVVALGVAERSRALLTAGAWIALLAIWLCGSFPLGRVPGGTLSLRPGHYVLLMAVPLIVFAAVRLARTVRVAP